MSDREHSITPRSASESLASRSKSRSRTPSAHSGRSRSQTRSRTRSRSPKRSYSRSRSRSHSKRYRNRRRHSRSRSRSPRRSRSRGGRYHRSHSRSPLSNRRRHVGNRENPPTSRCVGVFGLSLYTQDKDLRDVFSKYGPVDQVQIVYDHHTGRSRGFAFVYFERGEDARNAKERCNGIEVDGRRIRVDFSITQRAHTPTPGVYMGKPTGRYRRSPSPYRRGPGRYSRSRSRSYSRSPPPRIEERIKKG